MVARVLTARNCCDTHPMQCWQVHTYKVRPGRLTDSITVVELSGSSLDVSESITQTPRGCLPNPGEGAARDDGTLMSSPHQCAPTSHGLSRPSILFVFKCLRRLHLADQSDYRASVSNKRRWNTPPFDSLQLAGPSHISYYKQFSQEVVLPQETFNRVPMVPRHAHPTKSLSPMKEVPHAEIGLVA
jgi:hypothetical protein